MDSVRASVPGRSEVAGNHQDHQGGCVITGAIDRRCVCEAAPREDAVIRVESVGFEPFELDLMESGFAEPHPSERNSSPGLVRGMAAGLMGMDIPVNGCTLRFHSDIPAGMGFSSSAAFEVCAGAALAAVNGAEMPPMELARLALRAEREFFGKPCGMMDQAACALGGVQFMDFADRENPQVSAVTLPDSWHDWQCLLVDCGEGHAHTTSDYAAVSSDMGEVAALLGVDVLRHLTLEEYLAQLPRVRESLGDGAALRGLHFFRELALVERRAKALEANDMATFVDATSASSVSSAEYLQNVSVPGPAQEAMMALALSRTALDLIAEEQGLPRGSARIHGGGFGGTIQVFVPKEGVHRFRSIVDGALAPGSCLAVELGAPGVQAERA